MTFIKLSSKQLCMVQQDEIDILKKISKVKAPPFLLTNIEAKLETQKPNRINVGWSIGGSLAFSLMVVINIIVFNNNINTTTNQMDLLADELTGSADNILYNE